MISYYKILEIVINLSCCCLRIITESSVVVTRLERDSSGKRQQEYNPNYSGGPTEI